MRHDMLTIWNVIENGSDQPPSKTHHGRWAAILLMVKQHPASNANWLKPWLKYSFSIRKHLQVVARNWISELSRLSETNMEPENVENIYKPLQTCRFHVYFRSSYSIGYGISDLEPLVMTWSCQIHFIHDGPAAGWAVKGAVWCLTVGYRNGDGIFYKLVKIYGVRWQ